MPDFPAETFPAETFPAETLTDIDPTIPFHVIDAYTLPPRESFTASRERMLRGARALAMLGVQVDDKSLIDWPRDFTAVEQELHIAAASVVLAAADGSPADVAALLAAEARGYRRGVAASRDSRWGEREMAPEQGA